MKSLAVVTAAALLPLAVLAQPVQMNVACLSQAQQEEIRVRANAITSEIEARRQATAPPRPLFEVERELEEARTALYDCQQQARRERQSPGEMCGKQLGDLRAASAAVDNSVRAIQTAHKPLDLQEKERLEALRAQYPACNQMIVDRRGKDVVR